MMLLKMIGTLVIVTQLVTGLPMEQNECSQSKLCGSTLFDVLERACLGNRYAHCPQESDITMPKLILQGDIFNHCCNIGCTVGYLKIAYCNLLNVPRNVLASPTNVNKNELPDLRKFYLPRWIEKIWGYGNAPHEWPVQVYPENQQQPLVQMKK